MRVGIVGCGLIGNKRAAALGADALVAVCDRDPARAQALAAKLQSVPDAWRSVLGREPSDREREEATKFVERQTGRLGSKSAAYAELARGLMNLNEFLYVE